MKHHWTGKEPDPEHSTGFIYLITNLINGREYIGKKLYSFHRMVKGKDGGRRKGKTLPSNWEFYTGSCKELNGDIAKYGEGKFTFEILWNCSSRSVLHWMEIKEQVNREVLTKVLDGTQIPKYYNRMINGIKFIPKGTFK